MRGGDVAHAQWLLKHNRFGDFLPDAPIDGIYGRHTAQGARRAKFWLGYYYTSENERFGAELAGYLSGKRLPLANRIRRRRRLVAWKRHQLDTRQARAVTLAMGQIGYSPGLCSRYSAALGRPCENWCADFISWCQRQVGSRFNYAYVPYIDADASMGRNGLSLTYAPQRGALATFDWNHDGEADHVEYFIAWISKSAGSFWTVGGNTGSVGGRLGGQVLHQIRYTSEMWRAGEFVTVSA